jgi:hypothetical protein
MVKSQGIAKRQNEALLQYRSGDLMNVNFPHSKIYLSFPRIAAEVFGMFAHVHYYSYNRVFKEGTKTNVPENKNQQQVARRKK